MCILQMQRLILRDRKTRLSNLKAFQAAALLMRSEMQVSEESKHPFYDALYIVLSFSSEGTQFEQKLLPAVCTQTPRFICSTLSGYSFNGNGLVTSPLT